MVLPVEFLNGNWVYLNSELWLSERFFFWCCKQSLWVWQLHGECESENQYIISRAKGGARTPWLPPPPLRHWLSQWFGILGDGRWIRETVTFWFCALCMFLVVGYHGECIDIHYNCQSIISSIPSPKRPTLIIASLIMRALYLHTSYYKALLIDVLPRDQLSRSQLN